MADKKDDTPENTRPKMTAADAAKLVKRIVPVIDQKTRKPTGKTNQVAIKVDEIHDFKDYGDHVMVLTIDGQKLRGEKK